MPERRLIKVELLTAASFEPFGVVIQNPSSLSSSSTKASLKPVIANQGTAAKYADICEVENHYHLSSSHKIGRLAMSMFVCSPRQLRSSLSSHESIFDIDILERHPFTTQTFIPMGLSSRDPSTSYLVIVAPTKPVSSMKDEKKDKKLKASAMYARARPRVYDNDHSPPSSVTMTGPAAPWSSKHSMKKVTGQAPPSQSPKAPKGTGPPDLSAIRAFIARGDQAVTYGAGTWHAPMVVLGKQPIDFVVLQYVNGVSSDDCQENDLLDGTRENKQEAAAVVIDQASAGIGPSSQQLKSRI